MFTCDHCQRHKPDTERVSVHRSLGFIVGLVAPLKVSTVCRRCSGRVTKLGIFAVVGLLVISVVTLMVLDFAADFLN